MRPIVRGKFPLGTEFGTKILVAVERGCLHVIDCFRNNLSDATLVVTALRWFKTKFGHFPKELLGDRGFYSRTNVHFLKLLGITLGLQQRGKAIEVLPSHRRMIRQRLLIEAMVSLGKRKFGWNKCRARNPQHEASWIELGCAAMNVHRAFIMGHPP